MADVWSEKVDQAKRIMANQEADIRSFMREICAIPSVDGQIKNVLKRVAEEAVLLGFDEVSVDSMGCLIASIGQGPTTILYDAHLDTVGVGDVEEWSFDPFTGRMEGDVLFARGACDTKGCIPGMVYGLAMARDLGMLEGKRVVYFGSLEEQCDGQAPRALVEVEGLRPDYVVIGEPTDMAVFHGQRGRVEIAVRIRGQAAHASMPHLGDNPLYKLAQILTGIDELNRSLGQSSSPVGSGSIAATDIRCVTASINAVPSEVTLFLDRRLALDEDAYMALDVVRKCVPEPMRAQTEVEIIHYDEPSYTGFQYPVQKIFPAWLLPEKDSFLQAGLRTHKLVYNRPRTLGLWPASTNGTYWMGEAGIPSIGFGPGDLKHAHRRDEQVRMHDVVQATLFYAFIPVMMDHSDKEFDSLKAQ